MKAKNEKRSFTAGDFYNSKLPWTLSEWSEITAADARRSLTPKLIPTPPPVSHTPLTAGSRHKRGRSPGSFGGRRADPGGGPLPEGSPPGRDETGPAGAMKSLRRGPTRGNPVSRVARENFGLTPLEAGYAARSNVLSAAGQAPGGEAPQHSRGTPGVGHHTTPLQGRLPAFRRSSPAHPPRRASGAGASRCPAPVRREPERVSRRGGRTSGQTRSGRVAGPAPKMNRGRSASGVYFGS